ncbi:ribose-phosphate pyrophosphokinase 3, chloroplastic isoform X3 [Phoenix dactylifera]|uniref:Ribose-phosphate pyrophosphokinase 3, chloroplastic isoform X3 n=1 Tax=Phoenix dactylifera TaxID=42345 RepID=A0A8B7BT84_PHODC|nr:ribose-phosphate pyrophosphokinase 3, chloroplastic isoform X3 [Phoenix dactylifera]
MGAAAAAAAPPAPSWGSPKPNASPNPRFYKPKFVGARSLALPKRSSSGFRSELTSPDLSPGRSGATVHVSRSSPSCLMAASATVASSVALPPKRSRKNVLLFYCEEMRELAERVASEIDAVELRSISWRLFISSFTVVLPFFPTGSYERMEEEGDVATAFTLARILSNIPISRGGPTSLVIFDIHALQERFYFGDYVLPCFESGIPLLKNRLQQLPDSENICIAFPDDGSWKRFHKQLQHFPVIICNKVREGDQRFVRLKEGDPKGRHVVIVDDLVQSGSTLIECQKVLAAHGAAKVSAYVTHGIFPNRSWERFQYDNGVGPENGLSNFWITDSCPLTVKEPRYRFITGPLSGGMGFLDKNGEFVLVRSH